VVDVDDAVRDVDDLLASVARFADGVVALDCGAGAAARDQLDSHPLVRSVLPASRGEGSVVEDRVRLVAEAARHGADWIMRLRASERLAADDAVALRALVDDEADPAHLYLFRIYRMAGDLEHYDDARRGIGRLFAAALVSDEPGPPRDTNGVPVLPMSRRRNTTIRIQDVGALAVGGGHDELVGTTARLGPRAVVKPWWPRPPGFPALAQVPVPIDPSSVGAQDPVLSAIVIARNDEATIERSVRALVEQRCDGGIEVVVVTSGTDRTAQIVRERFPQVHVVELDHPALPGEARNAGWRVARGQIISFPGSHVKVGPGCHDARIRAHLRGYAMVCGRLLNGNPTPAGWAAFFLENGPVLPGRPSEPFDAPPPRCSYLRSALVEVGGFPEDMRTNEDTAVILELFHRGYSAYFEHELESTHYGPCTTVRGLVRHFFKRGRGLATLLLHEAELERDVPSRRMRRFVVANLPSRLRGVHLDVRRWGDGLRVRYVRTLPFIVIGAVAWWLGGCYEFARSAPAVWRRVRRDATPKRASS
jgi:glycosyltransferase involved in cell wall biosynthesis